MLLTRRLFLKGSIARLEELEGQLNEKFSIMISYNMTSLWVGCILWVNCLRASCGISSVHNEVNDVKVGKYQQSYVYLKGSFMRYLAPLPQTSMYPLGVCMDIGFEETSIVSTNWAGTLLYEGLPTYATSFTGSEMASELLEVHHHS